MDRQRLEALLAAMDRVGASALHLAPGRPPCLRVQRRLVPGDEGALTAAHVDELIRDMLFADHRERLARRGHVEVLCVSQTGRRYRATVTEVDGEHGLVMRPVPASAPKLDTLDLPEQMGAFTQCRSGLMLVAGGFGSGRSTTLAAVVDSLNQDPSRHIATVEDAIEFVHPPAAALLHQREVGVHAPTFAEGVRQAIALGVDTVVVSSIPDLACLDALLSAAESGCLVFAGVESGSVVGALADLVQLVAPELRARLRTRLARVLRGVAAQALLQRSHRAGRVPVVEILVGNAAAKQAIRLGNFHELPPIMQRCRGLGMQTVDLALRALLAQHLVAHDEAMLHASDRELVLAGARAPLGAR